MMISVASNAALTLFLFCSFPTARPLSGGVLAFTPRPRTLTPRNARTTQYRPRFAITPFPLDTPYGQNIPKPLNVYPNRGGPLYASLSSGDGDGRESQEGVEEMNLVRRVELAERFELAEFAGIAVWLTALSTFILMNEFVGPWPQNLMRAVPGNVWLVGHYIGGMLFAGGIVMTTCIEWLVASTKDNAVLKFWFGKVPLLDACVVLPGLTLTMIAGTGVSINHYGGLGKTPPHIESVFWTLVAFAAWWALTDLSTQHRAAEAIEKWAAESKDGEQVPQIVLFRRISNVVSCAFIIALYGIMTFKPGLAGMYS